MLVIAGAAAAIAAPGCSVGEKQAQADLIAAARTKTMGASVASAVVHLDSEPKATSSAIRESTDGGLAAGFGRRGPAALDVPVTFDFRTRRAAVVVAPPGAPADGGPTVVFENDDAYAQRVNRRAAERRVWALLDFGRLDDDERAPDQNDFTPGERLETLAKSLNPQYLLDLTTGTLAGSVERVGPTTMEGVAVTHYRANISLEMASTNLDLSEDELETRARVFRLVGITRDVNPAEYWVTDDGRLHRARFRFDQRLFPQVRNTITVALDFTNATPPPEVVAPTTDETIRLQRYARFVRTAVTRVAA